MQGFLRKLLNIQPGEGRRLGILYVLGFVVAASLVWGSAVSRGLFLKQVGIEWLPLIFIFDALLALPITVVYTAVVDRVDNARLLAVIFGGVGAVLLAGWGLLMLDQGGVAIPYINAVYALFYLAERVLRALFAIHAWTFFMDYFDTQSAKRALPVLGSTSRVAGFVAGPLVVLMAGILSAQNLIVVWVAILAIGVWLSLSIPRWLAGDRTQKDTGSGAQTARQAGSSLAAYWENLRGGFRFVSASSFLRWLAVGAFAMTALLVLMDYQAQRVFDQSYTTAEDLIGFYGALETVINLIALPVQMFLVSRLVSWLGVAQINLFYPLGSLLIYAALSIWPSLGTAMAGQFGKDTFRSSVQVPVDNMLYNAVPLPVKGRARAFIKGLLLPLATVTIGLLLLPVRNAGTLPWWLIGIGMAAALVQVFAALMVRRRYTQALVAMLAEEDFSAYRLAGSELGPPDPATFQRLVQRLQESAGSLQDPNGDPDMALFLARIVAEVGGREAEAPLVQVAGTAPAEVRAGILETLLRTGHAGQATRALARQSLVAAEAGATSEAGRLYRAALAVLEQAMGADNPDLWSLAVPLLEAPDPETRVQAILLLVRCGDFFYLAEGIRALDGLLTDRQRSDHRAAGLRVLQTMGDARMVRNLMRYLDDADDRVRLQAAKAIEALVDPEAPEWAVSLAREAVSRELSDPAEGVRLSALRTMGKVGGEEAAAWLIETLADPSELVREQASQGLISLGRAAVPGLEQVLVGDQDPEQKRHAAAAVLGRMARQGIVPAGDTQRHTQQVQALFEETLKQIYADARLIAAVQEIEPEPPPPGREEPPPDEPEPPAGKRELQADRPDLSALDALAALGRKRRTGQQLRPGQQRRGSRQREADETVPAQDPLAAKDLLLDGLRERNERRLESAFGLLSATLREPPTTVGVIARALRDSPVQSAARANALEALESITSSRVARLVGQLVPAGEIEPAVLAETAAKEWELPALEPAQALDMLLNDPDTWLAAIGIVLAGQGRLLDQKSLATTWLPAWQASPDPAVQEAARTTARRLELEAQMVETTPTVSTEKLSAVEQTILFKQVPFFAGMTVEQLRTLTGIAEEQYYEEAETIFAEGEPGEALYIVISGRVSIERVPKRGRVQRLETLKARQYFGERTIFDGAPHENRAVAIDRVHLLAIRREPLLALIRRSPDLSLSLVTVLSQRLREADAKLAARTRTKPDQVMRLYDKLAEEE